MLQHQLQHHNSKGFTLIETLVVLSIVTIMISILVISYIPIHKEKVIQQFIVQLKNDILLTQNIALTERRKVELVFSSTNKYFVPKSVFTGEKYFERYYSENIRLNADNTGGSITFNGIGNVSKAGSIILEYEELSYIVKIYLGKGRIHVEKL